MKQNPESIRDAMIRYFMAREKELDEELFAQNLTDLKEAELNAILLTVRRILTDLRK